MELTRQGYTYEDFSNPFSRAQDVWLRSMQEFMQENYIPGVSYERSDLQAYSDPINKFVGETLRNQHGDQAMIPDRGLWADYKLAAPLGIELASNIDPTPISDGSLSLIYSLQGRPIAAGGSAASLLIPFAFDKALTKPAVNILENAGSGVARTGSDSLQKPLVGNTVGGNVVISNRGIAKFPDRPPVSPAVDGSPFSPREVSKRQSELRRQLNTGNLDPDSSIPMQGPGRDLGGHPSTNKPRHTTGERNVASGEEHSRVPKRPDNRGGGKR